jgi:glyoxylate reductase
LTARKPSFFVSRRVPGRVRAELESRFALDVHDSEQPLGRAELLEAAAGRDGLVTMLTDAVDEDLLDAAGPTLRVVANYAVGHDNVDVEAASRRGVLVANTPDVLAGAVAELTIALMLALLRRVGEGDRLLRRRAPWAWAPTFLLGGSLRGRTLGIVGLGRIGDEVARLATAFGMEVVYTNRHGPDERRPYRWLELSELLERSDVVSLHCPLTPETRHLIGHDELRAMRSDAFLVNTTRGAVVAEEALAAALAAGEIAGAALDVFEREPEVSERLLELENVVLTPHLGSATEETREAMGLLCVAALEAVLIDGRVPDNAVNAA